MNNLKVELKEKIEYAIENKIGKVLMFIKDEHNILAVKEYLNEKGGGIELIGVTFPANEKMYEYNKEDDKVVPFVPDASNGDKVRDLLEKKNVKLISGTMPFEGIVIPGENYNPYKIVEQTLSLVHPALPNLVQTVLTATDFGVVLPKERVLVINAVLGIETIGTNSRLLFHPEEGLEIHNILT
ncbi:hypothetical protein JTI58_10895 [Lysinibacillus fusiformis]|uniref:hypothetical protein n=1 Tax=Lysinibacillus fusiformis TaxID=28031 RepID=UPI0019688909|nr:hypothetical protein [Lysinibacillus fusiformis]QSB12072.1 hypothetical protein JTI58_10895 [Lysinibacillus fusiformis]